MATSRVRCDVNAHFGINLLQCGVIAQGVKILVPSKVTQLAGKARASDKLLMLHGRFIYLVACRSECRYWGRGDVWLRIASVFQCFRVLNKYIYIYTYYIYTFFFSHSLNSLNPYCTTSRRSRFLIAFSHTLIVKAESRPNSLGHPCCKWCHVVVSLKCCEKMSTKARKKVIFLPLFNPPHVSVVYTFETFNVYVFYTSTDIFLVLFYNGKNLKW